jgi:hypothetical protein
MIAREGGDTVHGAQFATGAAHAMQANNCSDQVALKPARPASVIP